MNFRSIFLILSIIITACSPVKNLVYFSDLESSLDAKTNITNSIEQVIQPDDLLSITVSSLSQESNALFNTGVLLQSGSSINSGNSSTRINEGYLVDKNGFVNFPVIGLIQLKGLSKEEATTKMTAEISKYVKKPIVNVRFLNFKVTVMGEVVQPSTFTALTEKINILEALALAGDLTVYGKRDNVLIIREKDGVRSTARLNLNNKEVLNSPYFYLQQNDIVYVEPNKAKASQINLTRNNISFGLSIISVITLILFRIL